MAVAAPHELKTDSRAQKRKKKSFPFRPLDSRRPSPKALIMQSEWKVLGPFPPFFATDLACCCSKKGFPWKNRLGLYLPFFLSFSSFFSRWLVLGVGRLTGKVELFARPSFSRARAAPRRRPQAPFCEGAAP